MNIVSECIGVDAIALHSVTSVIKLIATFRKLQKISSLPIECYCDNLDYL